MDYACSKYRLVALLKEKMRILEKEISTLHQINLSEEFLDITHTELLQRHQLDNIPRANDTETCPGEDSAWK